MMRTLRFRALFGLPKQGPTPCAKIPRRRSMGIAVFFRIGSANAVSAQPSMRRRREHVLAEVVASVALG